MKILLLFLCITLLPIYGASGKRVESISYSFSLQEMDHQQLLVECTFQGNENGETQLILPYQWANQFELYKNIDGLKASQHLIENTEDPHIKVVHHHPHELITICYGIELLSNNINHENYYRPIGGASYFYAIGSGMFVLPALNDSKKEITLEWNGIPNEWKIANSFGQEEKTQTIMSSFEDLQAAVFMAGDFQIIECNPGAYPIYIAMRGEWPFSGDELTTLVEKIFLSQRNFWNDHEFPYFLVSVVPIDTKNSTGGTALKNAFSLFLGDNNFPKDDYLKHLAWLISHEHFHTWNGYKIRSSEPEGSMYWFSEGFTEYYAVKLNRQSGIMSERDYVDHMNGILRDYFASPVHHIPNETIVKNFWFDFPTAKLPYDRGFTLALYLDAKIQSKQEGRSLDHFMHDLFAITYQKERQFSFDDFLTLAATYLDDEDLDPLKRSIIEGETISLIEEALGSEYHLAWEEYVGFNLQESLTDGIIKGVQYGSISFQAGLLNGLKLLEFNQSRTLITLLLLNEKTAEQTTISYDLKETRNIPRYTRSINLVQNVSDITGVR